MIDCGCIKGGKATFARTRLLTCKRRRRHHRPAGSKHEHADHINGFEKCADLFDKNHFQKVWFAWTEDDTDTTANDYRKTIANWIKQ